MTEHQIRREARDMACKIEKEKYIVAAKVKERTEEEVLFIDQLLALYGIEKIPLVPLEGNFFLFYKIKNRRKRKKYRKEAMKKLPDLKKRYNEDMLKEGWNIVYW